MSWRFCPGPASRTGCFSSPSLFTFFAIFSPFSICRILAISNGSLHASVFLTYGSESHFVLKGIFQSRHGMARQGEARRARPGFGPGPGLGRGLASAGPACVWPSPHNNQIKLGAARRGTAQQCCPPLERIERRTDRRQTDSRQTDRQTDREKDRQTDRPKDRQTDRQAGRQAGKQADRQTDRQTERLAKVRHLGNLGSPAGKVSYASRPSEICQLSKGPLPAGTRFVSYLPVSRQKLISRLRCQRAVPWRR